MRIIFTPQIFGTTFALVLAILSSGCLEPGSLSNEDPKEVPATRDDLDQRLTRAIQEYLDGKEIPLSGGKSVKIKSKDIQAFELDKNRVQVNQGPWKQEGTFLVDIEDESHAVRFEISFREVEGKFAFFDFKAEEAVQQ